MYSLFIKPLADFLFALILILLLLPIFMVLIVLLYFFQGGNPFFTQARPGKNEKVFKLYKFRTMKNTKGTDGILLPDNERITKIGKFVRSSSLDELPQLFNVVLGQMSFIGPRPLLVKYLPIYNEEQKKRHNVKPGISGLAQVKGRNQITWESKFKLDVHYVENQNFMLDLQVLFLTFKKVLFREDINASADQTMKPFKKE
jgi:lipopolysaccharide/colanic/teichoic acid biosynthesis glycosyltransferase